MPQTRLTVRRWQSETAADLFKGAPERNVQPVFAVSKFGLSYTYILELPGIIPVHVLVEQPFPVG